MHNEGTIIGNFMLTKFVCRSPVAELFQSIHIESGERYLTKIALDNWQDSETDSINFRGFAFSPGQARSWRPAPSDLLLREFNFLGDVQGMNLPFLKPVEYNETDGTFHATYEFFDGTPLTAAQQGGFRLEPLALVNLCNELTRLRGKGIFHGNLQPGTVLVAANSVVLLDSTLPLTEFREPERIDLVRCITCPTYYPFLDPRHDKLALGLLLYMVFTGTTALAHEAPGQERPARRAGPLLGQMIDSARERGAARYVSRVLNLVNPSQLKRKLPPEAEAVVLKTIGFCRQEIGAETEMVEALPDSWLAHWLATDPPAWSEEPTGTWRYFDTAEALGDMAAKQSQRLSKQTNPLSN